MALGGACVENRYASKARHSRAETSYLARATSALARAVVKTFDYQCGMVAALPLPVEPVPAVDALNSMSIKWTSHWREVMERRNNTLSDLHCNRAKPPAACMI